MNIDPKLLFDMVASTIPKDLCPNVLIVGSLAAAYFYRDKLVGQVVATKDADVVVQPAGAIEECAAVAKRLLDAGWRRTDQCFPMASPEPADALRAIRLHPAKLDTFFVELLGLPQSQQVSSKVWEPCQIEGGWYGIPCFRFMALLNSDRRDTDTGIQHASPPLMALANLLSHPTLGTDRMTGEIEHRRILRSAKDLGRVLSLAWLWPSDLDDWYPLWIAALKEHFHLELREIALTAGDGLRHLLTDSGALEEAHFTTSVGLLRGHGVTVEQLRIIGQRILLDLVDPLTRELLRA